MRTRIDRIICFLALGAAAVAVEPQAAIGQYRVNLGIYGGQVHDLATYDNGGSTELLISVRSQNAIYRRGATGWEAVFTEGREGQKLEADLSPGNAGVVWATVDNKLYTHGPADPWDNSGWTLRGAISKPGVLVGAASGMYVSDEGTVYRSVDGGGSFTLLVSFSPGRVLDVAVYNAQLFYAVVGEIGNAKLYRCEDAGAGFVATEVAVTYGGGPVNDFETVGIDPQDPANAAGVARFYVGGNSAYCNVYRTTDGGVTWTRLPLSTHNGYPTYIKFTSFKGSRRMFVTADYSDDYGDTWHSIPNPQSATGLGIVQTHANDGAIAFDPNNDKVYFPTDWAVGEWDMNTAASTEVLNAQGIEAVLLNDVAQIQTNATTKATLWIASKSGLGKTTTYPSTSSSSDWLFPIYPDGDGSPMQAVAIHPNNLNVVLAGSSGGGVYRTTIGGETSSSWKRVLSMRDAAFSAHYTVPDRAGISDLKILETNPDIIYASARATEGAMEGGVYWSQNNGQTWSFDFTNTSGAAINVPVNCLLVLSQAVWAGVGDEGDSRPEARGLYARLAVEIDGDWWKFSTGTTLDGEVVTAIDGTQIGGAFTIYVATEGGLYKGVMNSAVTSVWAWKDVSPSPGSRYTAVAVNPGDEDEVYAAYGNRIYGSRDGGITWNLLPPSGTSAHEQVFTLFYDDLIVGTSNGLFAPTQAAYEEMAAGTGGLGGADGHSGDGDEDVAGFSPVPPGVCGFGLVQASLLCLPALMLLRRR